MIFDGKAEAEKIKKELLAGGKLNGKSLLIIQADGSKQETTYVRLKRQMGEALGVAVEIEYLSGKAQVAKRLAEKIEGNGVLVQLPIVGASRDETQNLLNLIPAEKDIDGLRRNGRFLPAVVKAIDHVVVYALIVANLKFATAAVVGAGGMMGQRLVEHLRSRGMAVTGYDLGDDLGELVNFDLVVGATGQAGLIKGEMVKEGVIALDLGYPVGDFEFAQVRAKAGLITPVPGGIGPLTVISLFENLAQS